jgi:hypothetical protein
MGVEWQTCLLHSSVGARHSTLNCPFRSNFESMLKNFATNPKIFCNPSDPVRFNYRALMFPSAFYAKTNHDIQTSSYCDSCTYTPSFEYLCSMGASGIARYSGKITDCSQWDSLRWVSERQRLLFRYYRKELEFGV